MNNTEFHEVLQELGSYYGDKPYSQRMVGMLWQILQPISRSEAMQIVEALAQKHVKAPTPAMVKQEALPFLARAHERRRQAAIEELEAGAPCSTCGHTGYVLALLRSDPRIEYSFRCPHCVAARVRRIDPHIREWADELRERYIPVSLRLESHTAARALQAEAEAQGIAKRRGAGAGARQPKGPFAELARSVEESLRRGRGFDLGTTEEDPP